MKKILLSIALAVSGFAAFSQCNNLFISEYVEGNSFNKSIEIYNPTTLSVPLTGAFSIRIYYNGSITPTTIALTGTINPGSTFVISHSSASAAILALSNQTNAGITFNGNDAVELYNTFLGAPADVIGIIGNDPGTEWLVNGSSGTLNKTLIRKPAVQQGNLVWTGSGEMEWDIFAQDYIANLGAHTMTPCAGNPPIAEFSWMDVCDGFAMPFSDLSAGGSPPYAYFWDFGDGSGTSNSQNPSYTFGSSGTYNVQLIVVDQSLLSDTIVHTVTVFGNPVACTSPMGGDGCVPDTVTFTNCSTGSGPLSYQWNFSNGNSSTAFEPQEIFTNDTAWFFLEVTDFNGCVGTLSDTGYMSLPDDASFNYSQSTYCIADPNQTPTITGLSGGTFSSSTASINTSTGEVNLALSGAGCHQINYTTNGMCPSTATVSLCITSQLDATITPAGPFCELGVPNNLTAVDAGGTWSGNGIIDANLGTFDASAAGAGNHEIIYTISGACGDDDTTYIDVYANAIVNIITSDTNICNDSFGFFLEADSGGVWTGPNVSDGGSGDGFFSSGSVTPGVYYATYTISGMCGDADSVMVTVVTGPAPAFSFTVTGATVNFTNTTSGAGNTYSWNFGDGNNSSLTSPSHTYTANGTFNVCLYVTSSDGCVTVDCQSVTITGVGVEEITNSDFRIYPNPASNIVNVVSDDKISSYSITDITGRIITNQKNVLKNSVIISVDQLNGGAYFLQVQTINGKVKTEKIHIIR